MAQAPTIPNDVKIAELPPISVVDSLSVMAIVQDIGGTLLTGKATVADVVTANPPRAHTHQKMEVGLGQVDNTSDINKPTSLATSQAIIDAVALHELAADPHSVYTTTAEAALAAPVQSVAGRTGAVVLTSTDVGLGNVANLAPADIPLSTAAIAALALKRNTVDKINVADLNGLTAAINTQISTAGVSSVNARTGAVVLTAADVGLSNVANIAPANMPVSTAAAAALALKVDTASVGVASGVAPLGADGIVPAANLPLMATGHKLTVANAAARLAIPKHNDLTIVYQADDGSTWAIDANATPSNAANWTQLGSAITSSVTSFASRTGVVTPQAGDYTAAMVGAEAAGVAAASMATHIAAADPHPGYTTAAEVSAAITAAAPVPVTAASIGLGNVNNTSDASKPVSTATATALAAKADKLSPLLDGVIGEKINVLGTVGAAANIDLTLGAVVTATAVGATTWTVTGTPPAGYGTSFVLSLTNGGAGAQSFFAAPLGAPPTLQAAGTDRLVFAWDGSTWAYAKAGV